MAELSGTGDYPWYHLVSGSDLEQGDLLFGCPVFEIPPQALQGGTYEVRIRKQNVIVLTQSCDLAVRADGSSLADDVILCPVYSQVELQGHKIYGKSQGWEDARKGRHNGYHVLNRCEIAGYAFDFFVGGSTAHLYVKCGRCSRACHQAKQ